MTPKKLRALMNNPAEAPLYPYPPDYTNPETAQPAPPPPPPPAPPPRRGANRGPRLRRWIFAQPIPLANIRWGSHTRSLALGFRCPALKRMIKVETFPGALKRSFPRINAGAPTKKYTPWVSHRVFQQPVKPCPFKSQPCATTRCAGPPWDPPAWPVERGHRTR